MEDRVQDLKYNESHQCVSKGKNLGVVQLHVGVVQWTQTLPAILVLASGKVIMVTTHQVFSKSNCLRTMLGGCWTKGRLHLWLIYIPSKRSSKNNSNFVP